MRTLLDLMNIKKEEGKMTQVKEYNKTLYDMMKRDSSFNIKMQKLGYKLQPVVGVIDMRNRLYHSADGSVDLLSRYPLFNKYSNSTRYRELKDVEKIGVTASMEKIGKKNEEIEQAQARNPLIEMFEYEMLLMAKLEKELGKSVSKDKLMHIVEEHATTPGYTDTVEKIEKRAQQLESPEVRPEPLILTKRR